MGSYDGSEVCEMVGLYILSILENHINQKHIGLYRDDGLAAIPGSGPQVERMRKQIIKEFKKIGLQVTTEVNIKRTDFLDIFFDLDTETFKPFRKKNEKPVYINTRSNHPKIIIQQLPEMIENRISSLSSNKEIFDQEIVDYADALKNSGYNRNLTFRPTQQRRKKNKNRSRNILWFNPPYSESVKTNLGSKFLKLVDKHFKNSPLHKYFNRKNVKISYSCLPNISAIISGHNRSILKEATNNDINNSTTRECNCRDGPQSCPLQGNCLKNSIIYQASLSTTNEKSSYLGQAGNTFKERFNNHKQSFRCRAYEHSTALAKKVWSIKDQDQEFNIDWKILKSAPTYRPESSKCHLCNIEKTLILLSTDDNLLNKRSELMNKCRHRRKYLLSNVT